MRPSQGLSGRRWGCGAARVQRPGAPVWLAGFSFGAVVALRAARRANPVGLITVAPAVHLYDLSTLSMPVCPWLLIQGEADATQDPSTSMPLSRPEFDEYGRS